jgi:hypothetical protein
MGVTMPVVRKKKYKDWKTITAALGVSAGKIVGPWTVLHPVKGCSATDWRVRCNSCNRTQNRSYDLIANDTRKGCKFCYLVGEKFHELTVINHTGKVGWLCQCICSKYRVVPGFALRSGLKSCGCRKHREKHGFCRVNGTPPPTYWSWQNMKRRCVYNPNVEWFKHYAGRGIQVCERWKDPKHGFQSFLEDMGARPEGMTLDRVNVDGNYEKSNCRWATPKEQVANRRPEEVS